MSLRHALHEEFESRRSRNARYSWRSFARNLEIPVSSLTEIVRGKRVITKRVAEKLIVRLNLLPSRSACVDLQTFKNRNTSGKVEAKYSEFGSESYDLIFHWVDFAVLSLTHCTDFVSDEAWMARRLGLAKADIENAIRRLEKHGLLKCSKNPKTYRATKYHVSTASPIPSYVIQRSHLQNLELAKDAVTGTPMELRDLSFINLAMNPAKLPEAARRIKKFRRQLSKWLEGDRQRTEVYRLAIQIFPISKIAGKQGERP
jgi:uncharacterized protein (TIGR02147 family)